MRRRGFTLVEVLVVISILAMLVSILLPALRAAREQARAGVCGAKIRQLLLALCNYDQAQGSFPYGFILPEAVRGDHILYPGELNRLWDPPGRWWFDYSLKVDYVFGDGLDVLKCPSKHQGDPALSRDILAGNYGANPWICRVTEPLTSYAKTFGGRPLSFATIPQPASRLLLVDSGYSIICWWHATEQPPVALSDSPLKLPGTAYVPGLSINKDKNLLPGQTDDAVNGRHPNKTVNVGFVDGHVDRRRAEELLVKSTDDGWDCSPFWQPRRETITAPGTSP